MRTVLLGAPGSGKGTQGVVLAKNILFHKFLPAIYYVLP